MIDAIRLTLIERASQRGVYLASTLQVTANRFLHDHPRERSFVAEVTDQACRLQVLGTGRCEMGWNRQVVNAACRDAELLVHRFEMGLELGIGMRVVEAAGD